MASDVGGDSRHMILVLGTRNEKKRRELTQLLALPELKLATLAEYPNAPEVEESGETFLANAELKATTLARAIDEWVLGEDSGLCVDALGGRPGIFSARYSGVPTDDERNNDKLLAELEDIPEEKRTCRYVCAAVLCDPSGRVRGTSEGFVEGRIARERRGSGGFGYDPLFLVGDGDATFGELPLAAKQEISHRAEAILRLRPRVLALMRDGDWRTPAHKSMK